MKNKLFMILLAIGMIVGLAACTRSDMGGGQAGSSDGNGAGAGTIEVIREDVSSIEVADNQGEQSFEAALGEEITNEDVPSGDTGGEAASPAQDEMSYTPEEYDALDEADLPDEGNVLNEDEEQGWNGSYISETSEVLKITQENEETISFEFATSGIYGTAELDGNQATFHGDDQHVIVFAYMGTSISVTVLSEEDFDASASPLNGEYSRERKDNSRE